MSSNYINFRDEDTSKDQTALLSDKEVHPDELSDDHGEGHAHKEGAPKASIFGSALNIANTIMGAGVLALPNVIRQFGMLLGSAIILFSMLMTWISCTLLLKAKNLSKHSKFITIGKHCFGHTGMWIVKAIIIVNNFGVGIIYLIVFSTVAANLVKGFAPECEADGGFYCQHWFLVLAGATVVTPFIFASNMSKLQAASAVSVCAAITFSIITIENYISYAVQGKSASDIHVLPHIDNVTAALSSITSVFLAFTFQFNFFPVYKSLSNPTDKRMKATTGTGLLIVVVVYLTVANCGYLTFGEDAQDLLSNFTRDKLPLATFIIINGVLLISSTLTQPLMFFGAKNEIYRVIKIIRRHLDHNRKTGKVKSEAAQEQQGDDDDDAAEDEEHEQVLERKYGFKGIYYKLYIAILYSIIVALAIVVPGINTVFSFVGSTAANGLNFVLPTAFYLKLCSRHGKLRRISWAIMILGIVMGVIGIVTSALNL